jgi:hypothetical protein
VAETLLQAPLVGAFGVFREKKKKEIPFSFVRRKPMTAADIPWTPGNPNDRSVFGFSLRHGGRKGPMSKSQYYSLRKAGLGPQEQHVGGSIKITQEAEAEWDQRMVAPLGTAARLARREAQAAKKQTRKKKLKQRTQEKEKKRTSA